MLGLLGCLFSNASCVGYQVEHDDTMQTNGHLSNQELNGYQNRVMVGNDYE